jgi:membrane fusion protein (multidrug efflux system)
MLIKEGQKVLIKPLGDKMTFPTEIHSISRNIDEAKQTLAAQAHLHQNDRSLTVGSIVNADIIVDPEKVYSLPNEAIVAVEGQHYIFVHEGDKFVQHQVTIGITNESFTQILNYSDFMDKELVVKGAYYMIE